MALPTLAVVVAAALWGISVAAARVQCVDAAHNAARAAARGEPDAAVTAVARAAAPAGATVFVQHNVGAVAVVVRARVGVIGGVLAHLPAPVAAATAVAVPEPTS